MKNLLLFLLFSVTLPSMVYAQDFEKRFAILFKENDQAGQLKLLNEWESKKPDDPELFVSYFNYYAVAGKKEVIELGENQRGNNSYVITDTGTEKKVGYINSVSEYDMYILQKGFDIIDKGIAKHPKRLDMRFGKVYMLGVSKKYDEYTNTIVEAIDYGKKIHNAWLWKDGEKLKDSEDFFLSTVQSYITTLYNTEDDNLLKNIRLIAEAVLQYYPTHVESLSNIALTYIVIGENDKGLPYLLKAEKINPKDIIVLSNIAEVYKRLNDKVNARLYYQKIIEHGKKDDVEYATEQLKNL